MPDGVDYLFSLHSNGNGEDYAAIVKPFENGVPTTARPGKLIRGRQPAPA